MTFPYPSRPGPGPARQPGILPLRPLAVGEILAAGITVVRRHFLPLAMVSLVVSVLGAAATWGVLAATGDLDDFVTGAWLDAVLDGTTTAIPTGVLLATLLSLAMTVAGGVLTAGLASIAAGQDALGRPTSRADWSDRLANRWPALLGVAALTGVLVAIGLMLFIVPGALLYLAWLVAAPVVTMERSPVGSSLGRSARLTAGQRGRLFGLVVAVLAVTVLLSMVASSIIGSAMVDSSVTSTLVVSEAVTAVLSMFTGAWAGAVIAVAYIDLRIRKEDLAAALAAAAD